MAGYHRPASSHGDGPALTRGFDHIGSSSARSFERKSRLARALIRGYLPFHVYKLLRRELRLARVRRRHPRVRRHFAHRRDLLVNIGAGEHGRDGWVNVDAFPGRGVDCLYDCRQSLPFADESVRGIFTEHFLEHLDYTEEVPAFLAECHRVLCPGGVLRVVVPDAGLYLRAYGAGGWADLERIRPLDAGHRDAWRANSYRTRMELINEVFRQEYEHKYAWDDETLELALRQFGFEPVLRRAYRQSSLPELAIDREVRASESLYVEGIKPRPGETSAG